LRSQHRSINTHERAGGEAVDEEYNRVKAKRLRLLGRVLSIFAILNFGTAALGGVLGLEKLKYVWNFTLDDEVNSFIEYLLVLNGVAASFLMIEGAMHQHTKADQLDPPRQWSETDQGWR
jgi:hypothetical protein